MIHPTTIALSMAALLGSTAYGYAIKVNSHGGGVETYEHASNLTADEFLSNRQAVTFHRVYKALNKRDNQCPPGGHIDYNYRIVGDGDPHQNYKIGQVENTLISCPGTVATGQSHTNSWSIGGGFNPGVDEFDFGSVGFDVGESDTQTVTDSFTCTGTDMTEICAMHYTAVTAVTVEFFATIHDCDDEGSTSLGNGVVYLPNANGVGSTISRGTSFGPKNIIQCRGQAAREVDWFCGPPGGPEWFDTNEYGPWSDAYMAQRIPADCVPPIEAYKFLQ